MSFFNNQNPNPNPNNLFGQLTNNQTNNSTITTNQNNPNSSNLFTNPNTKNIFNNLNTQQTNPINNPNQLNLNTNNQTFGLNTMNQTNLFGKTNQNVLNINPIQQQSNSLFTHNQNLGINNINNQNQLNYVNLSNSSNYKKESDKKEIIDVVQSYLNCLNIKSPFNSFKYILYNKVTEESANMINLYQQPKNQDFTDEGEPFLINQELWHKALRNNPDPSLFYPNQICSPKALDGRAKILEVLEFQKLDYLINLKQKLNNLSLLYDNDIQNVNSTIKNKVNLMKHKQMMVIFKLEKLANITGKAEKNYNMENMLNSKLNDLKSLITNKDSYVSRLKNLSSMTTLMSFDNNSNESDEDPLKDFTKERFSKDINVLKNLKKTLDINFGKLRKSLSDLNSIKNDLDCYKKYGRINK